MNKNLDKQGRWRNKTVSFRMSKKEVMLLDNLVLLSGLTKQDYCNGGERMAKKRVWKKY